MPGTKKLLHYKIPLLEWCLPENTTDHLIIYAARSITDNGRKKGSMKWKSI